MTLGQINLSVKSRGTRHKTPNNKIRCNKTKKKYMTDQQTNQVGCLQYFGQIVEAENITAGRPGH